MSAVFLPYIIRPGVGNGWVNVAHIEAIDPDAIGGPVAFVAGAENEVYRLKFDWDQPGAQLVLGGAE